MAWYFSKMLDDETSARCILYVGLLLVPALVMWWLAAMKLRRARRILAAAEAKERAADAERARAEDLSERLARALGLASR